MANENNLDNSLVSGAALEAVLEGIKNVVIGEINLVKESLVPLTEMVIERNGQWMDALLWGDELTWMRDERWPVENDYEV